MRKRYPCVHNDDRVCKRLSVLILLSPPVIIIKNIITRAVVVLYIILYYVGSAHYTWFNFLSHYTLHYVHATSGRAFLLFLRLFSRSSAGHPNKRGCVRVCVYYIIIL